MTPEHEDQIRQVYQKQVVLDFLDCIECVMYYEEITETEVCDDKLMAHWEANDPLTIDKMISWLKELN